MSSAAGLVARQFRLAARPTGLPDQDTWVYAERAIAQPAEGELLVKVLYVSLDPAMRMWVNDGRSYIAPVAVGEVMRAIGLGRVVVSRAPAVPEGAYVTGLLGVQDYAVVAGDAVQRIDPELAPLPLHLGALGLTGMSAYFGLLDLGRPTVGETVVVSAAAGAVGSIAGQIARIKGCRVVGIAGGARKCAFLTEELGFDAAVDYRRDDLPHALVQACPDRIDVFFDNVGGAVLDTALSHLRTGARVVISGAISQYNAGVPQGPSNYLALAVDRARMEGFIVTDYAHRFPEAARELVGWIDEGLLRSREHIVEGLESFPQALLRLFTGDHDGKLMIRVAGR